MLSKIERDFGVSGEYIAENYERVKYIFTFLKKSEKALNNVEASPVLFPKLRSVRLRAHVSTEASPCFPNARDTMDE